MVLECKGQYCPLAPLDKRSEGQLPFVPAPLAVFEKIYNYRHGVLVVKSVRLAVERSGFNHRRVIPKYLKELVFTVSLLDVQH